MITLQMTPFFHLLFHLYLFVHFIFAFQDLENSVPWGPPLHYLLVYKIHFHMPKMTLWSLLAYIYFFLQKVCKLLVYNMFCSQYDNKLTPIPWTKLNLRKKIIWCEARNWKPYKRFVLSQNFLYWFGNCSSKKLLNCSVWQEPWEFKKCHVWVCVSYLHPQFLPLMCLSLVMNSWFLGIEMFPWSIILWQTFSKVFQDCCCYIMICVSIWKTAMETKSKFKIP